MSDHTPAPWVFVGGKHGYEIQTAQPNDKGALTIVASQSTVYRSPKENEANANLIAAAPELLEAVKDALSFLDRPDAQAARKSAGITTYEWYQVAPEHVGKFRRAIAKATGAIA